MNKRLIIGLLLLLTICAKAQQKIIQLYNGAAPGSESWTWDEKEKNKNDREEKFVYNVVHPSLEVYLPNPAIATGTAIVVCPGGGFYYLEIDKEGRDVAKWLNQKGIAVFILKYRLSHSLTDDPMQEMGLKRKNGNFEEQMKPIIPLATADGLTAISYVRQHAAEYNISPSRIGIMGFSAGGTVAASAAFKFTADNRPDFAAPIYPYFPPALLSSIPADAPPLFIAVASDDALSVHSVNLYENWSAAKHHAELHIYAKGGHGFGIHKQNTPSDYWTDQFTAWLDLQGMLKPVDPKVSERIEQREKYRKAADDQFHNDWANIKRYETENSKVPPPVKDEKRVVFMGNSITEGWKNNDPSFFADRTYYDRGISGQTTGQMLIRFREDVINLNPSVVVILAGINDIAENNGPSKLEDVFGNIVSMVQLAKISHIKVVVSSVMPAFAFPWRLTIDPKPSVTALNAMLKDYCDKNKIVYLDYFTAMADERRGLPANISKDGVHPNLDGYKIMEPLAEKAIDEAMKRK